MSIEADASGQRGSQLLGPSGVDVSSEDRAGRWLK